MKIKKIFFSVFMIAAMALMAVVGFSGTNKVDAADLNIQSADEIFDDYYNSGYYTKQTEIKVKAETGVDISQYFHDSGTILKRVTYYNGDELWMTNPSDVSTKINSGYGTSDEGMTHFKKVNGQNVVDYTVKDTSMEEYYVTLQDISTANVDWNLSSGVYSSIDNKMIDMFVAFTAPLWIGKTADKVNYLTYHHVEVSEKDDVLTLSLFVSSSNSGSVEGNILGSGDNKYILFSQAKVSKLSKKIVLAKYSGATTNMSADDVNNAKLIGLNSDWSVNSSKKGSSNFAGLNKDGEIRLYYDNSNINNNTVLTFNYTASVGLISNVIVNCSNNNNDYKLDIVDTNSFTIGNKSQSKQVRITSIAIELYLIDSSEIESELISSIFEFGANGTASHDDGKAITTTTFVNNNQSLTFTSYANVYENARDAKGNSCLK